MTLKQLEAFYWAATLGTFAIASRRLNVTQSTLSKRINELEASLDQSLFDRSSKRPTITAAGEKLLAVVKQILELTESARSASGPIDQYEGHLHFGVSELSAATWFPTFANRVRDEHPKLILEPQIGEGKMLEHQVERGELDFAVIAGVGSLASIASETVAEVDFAWMGSPSRHQPFSGFGKDENNRDAVITPTSGSKMTAAFSSWASAMSIDMSRPIRCNSLTTTVGLVVAGAGIGCLPEIYVSALVERGLLAPVREMAPELRLSYSIIWRLDDTRSLITRMKALVMEDADFNIPNVLWSF